MRSPGLLLAMMAAAGRHPGGGGRSAGWPAQDPGGLEVAARRAGRDVDRQDGGGPVVVCRDAAGLARHDGPRWPGLSPWLSGHRTVRRRERAVPVSRFERRRRRGLRRRAVARRLRNHRPISALLLRKDGSATVMRRTGGTAQPIAAWAPSRGRTPRRQGRREARVAGRGRHNGADLPGRRHQGGDHPRADAPADGHFGLRIGRGVNIHVVRLDFTQQLAPPRAPKPGV